MIPEKILISQIGSQKYEKLAQNEQKLLCQLSWRLRNLMHEGFSLWNRKKFPEDDREEEEEETSS